jgi:hypothetical protein
MKLELVNKLHIVLASTVMVLLSILNDSVLVCPFDQKNGHESVWYYKGFRIWVLAKGIRSNWFILNPTAV